MREVEDKEKRDAALSQPVRILIAEDNAMNRAVLETLLMPSGAELVFAHDGEQAVQAFANDRYDVVLMDINMPVLDGMGALEAIRAHEDAGDDRTPVIALTANVMADHIEAYKTAGFDGILEKPLSVERLYQAISDVVESVPET